ncbi:hypothetical protein [Methylobrevis pamukkalensis]|uniref:Uncharacterized protein n=1 Tax=Methylobrevis pamukkalensis TaxID=1439726 RepID=A0A1E3GZ56_9HYPH|nr:hypothetical protein [Methylobrevis pamukkalensis]ODN69215.1 hypothetical protein A6302_03477 [Methylobrevis pamukkalensis]
MRAVQFEDSFGAYTGIETFVLAFNDGQAFGSFKAGIFGNCENAIWEPFPEAERIG